MNRWTPALALLITSCRHRVAPVSGYRVYADDVISLLGFIQQGQRLGLTLAEIKHIISLRRSGAAPCAHVRRLLAQKEADLKALLAEVRRILKAWPLTNGLHAVICPHIEARGGDTVCLPPPWHSLSSRRLSRLPLPDISIVCKVACAR
jgi:DNA-binding transcriptional MerR regulator